MTGASRPERLPAGRRPVKVVLVTEPATAIRVRDGVARGTVHTSNGVGRGPAGSGSGTEHEHEHEHEQEPDTETETDTETEAGRWGR